MNCNLCPDRRCEDLSTSGRLENGNLEGEPIDPAKVVIRKESIEECHWR
jgi:hypothetical protein